MSRCIAYRYEKLGDPSTPAEAAKQLPIALGVGDHIVEMSKSVLYPLPSANANRVLSETKDQQSDRKFNDFIRKGCRDCPMPDFDLDVDPEPAHNEDDIEMARLEKSMSEYIQHQKSAQRKRRVRATVKRSAQRLQPMKRGRHTGDDVRGDFEPEDRCRIHGLVHASEYNGLEGTVIKWSENMGRWHVLIDLDDGSTTL